MRKFAEFDKGVMADLKSVPAASFAEKIKMISVDNLEPHKGNFYSMAELEMLADDIDRQGLKHNLVVYENKDNAGTYTIVSGHRRYMAVKILIESGRLNVPFVPCFVTGEKDESETLIDLIMLNKTTREMSDNELMLEYETLKNVFDMQKESGKKIKGKMRDNIAKILGVSPRLVNSIGNIKGNAIPEIEEAVKTGELSISKAGEIAKLDEFEQKKLIKETPIKDITPTKIKQKKSEKKQQNISFSEKEDDFVNSESVFFDDIETDETVISTELFVEEFLEDETDITTKPYLKTETDPLPNDKKACLGYAVKACEKMGYPPDVIVFVIRNMKEMFSFVSENEAVQYYEKSQF